MKASIEYGEKYRGFRSAWYVEGHRLHKNENVHQCWKEACAYSDEHSRTEVVIIEWIARSKDYSCMAVLLDNQAQPERRVQINREGVFNNGNRDN